MDIKFEWTPDLSVGENHIDEQHQKLLARVNELLEAILQGEAQEVIADTIQFFDRYAQEHFQYEEEYMRENGYPGLAEHQLQHQGFEKQYKEFKRNLASGMDKEQLALQVENYLGKWWLQHIGEDDKQYSLYIAQHNEG